MVVTYVDMRSSTNLYLANLSVADLLVLLICLPSGLAEFHSQEEWFLGDIICKCYKQLNYMTTVQRQNTKAKYKYRLLLEITLNVKSLENV